MLRIRMKMGPSSRNNEWKCCFGLHVRTATIIIGVWHLILNVLALGILAIIIRTNNRTLLNAFDDKYDDIVIDQDAPALPTPLSKIDPPYAFRDHSLNYHDVDMSGLVCLCMIAITLMMIYGAIKEKPSNLLPFFCLQIFDFAVTTLTAAGYLCYLRSVHHLLSKSRRLPWREVLLQLSPQSLSLIMLVAFIIFVLLKAYAIGIVWRCYKFLTMRQHNLRSMLPYIIPDVNNIRQERDYSSLLPDYEEAIAQSMKQAPPPSYNVAMSSMPVPVVRPDSFPSTSTIITNDNVSPPEYNMVTDLQLRTAQITKSETILEESFTKNAANSFNDVASNTAATSQFNNENK